MAETTAPVVTGNVYSEAQHFSLLKSAVEQETAALTAEKSELQARIETLESEKAEQARELSEVKSQIDVLESAKAAAEAAATTARTELDTFKSEIARKERIAELKKVRVERVKAANENLADDFFSDERAERWAEMADEAFDALVREMTEFAAATKPAATTRENSKTTTEQARESAAFAGGEAPSTAGDDGVTPLAKLLAARRGIAV